MCLYPKLIKNPKYKKTKKNGGVIPAVRDKRVMAVPIGCGRCAECMKKKANEWRVRLMEEIRDSKNGHFVTLTFSDESIKELKEECETEGYELDNDIAKLATRRFLERWRKKYKKSVRHWLTTELGHQGTENVHMHGIIWTDKSAEEIEERWKYGHVWAGAGKRTYVNEKTVNYIIKYVTKVDGDHKYYKPVILCSPGIGAGYTKRSGIINNKYKKGETKEHYRAKNGIKMGLPVYYRNKVYTEDEREKLWIEKLDKNKRYVDGIEIDISKGNEQYLRAVKIARKKYKSLGYGGDFKWKEKEYEESRRRLLQKERIERATERKAEPMAMPLSNEKW